MAKGRRISCLPSKGPLPLDGRLNIPEFKYLDVPIKWIKRLDDDECETFVYRVNIASQDYALKVVSKDIVVLSGSIY